MALINLYKDNPSVGMTDGVLVSAGGDFSSPISFTLDAGQNESAVMKLAVRCQTGYQTSGDTIIQDQNDSADRLKLSLTESGGWSDSLTFNQTIGATNVVFFLKASSSSSEMPQLDRTASLKVTATLVPAS